MHIKVSSNDTEKIGFYIESHLNIWLMIAGTFWHLYMRYAYGNENFENKFGHLINYYAYHFVIEKEKKKTN